MVFLLSHFPTQWGPGISSEPSTIFLDWLDPNVLLAGVLSAVIAIVSVFIGAWVQRDRDRKKELADIKDQRTHLAKALHAELSALQVRYERTIGKSILEAKAWTDLGSSIISHGYFTVFDQNAGKVGLFKDEDTRVIIQAYVSSKGHADNLRTWSQAREQMHRWLVDASLARNPDVSNTIDAQAKQSMDKYFQLLKKDRETLLAGFQEAKAVLEKYF